MYPIKLRRTTTKPNTKPGVFVLSDFSSQGAPSQIDFGYLSKINLKNPPK